MSAAGLIFALTRLQIQMDAYPKWGDMVSVETWFQEEGRVAASRHWVLRDADTGAELGRATSTWVMVDTRSRRLVKMPEPMRAKLESLSPAPARLSIPANAARLRIPDLMLLADEPGRPADAPPLLEGPKQVARRADMDMNGHINNVTYLAWALETVPPGVYADGHLAQVELDYKSECLAGHTVESLAMEFEGEVAGLAGSATDGRSRFLHTLRRCDEEGCYELVRARTTWEMPR
jgi:fatty acyl-ACP thioesterase A